MCLTAAEAVNCVIGGGSMNRAAVLPATASVILAKTEKVVRRVDLSMESLQDKTKILCASPALTTPFPPTPFAPLAPTNVTCAQD